MKFEFFESQKINMQNCQFIRALVFSSDASRVCSCFRVFV